MQRSPLGSWTSWLVDGLLIGPLQLSAAMVVSQALLYADDPQSVLGASELLHLLPLSLAVVACVGGCAALPVWAVASRSWTGARGLALAVGPTIGGLCAVASMVFTRALLDGRGELPPSGIAAGAWLAGATLVGPPWFAYVAVRARGRRGLGVVLGAAVWATVPIAVAFAIQAARRYLP